MPVCRRSPEALFRALLVAGSILFSLVLLELGLHLANGPHGLLEWPNIVRHQRVSTHSYTAARARYDSKLGFVGSPNYSEPDFHYDAHGLRVTPVPAGVTLAEPPILAVGGSYTLGDEVADSETYPAQLQALIRRRVVNAGMEAYGLDQMVLRAELMTAEEKPAAIILSFGADNLRRMEMSRVWGVEKPYFTLTDGKLVLRNVPVPPSPDPATTLDIWQRLFGRSLLVDLILRHFGWQYEWSVDHVRVLPRDESVKLSCPLFKRMAALGVPTIVVAEYDPYLWTDLPYMREQNALTNQVLHCAAAAGFVTIDPFEEIDKGMRSAGRDLYYRKGEHPSPAGQALVARLVAEALQRLPQ
jgi:GDSL-like Lipase/Acylhydrolase family